MPAPATDPAALPALLAQVAADLADPAVSYLLVGHYYNRTNHRCYRHFPAVFALRHGEITAFETGPDFVAFDITLVRYPERDEPHYPGPWADHFRATVPFSQLYRLCRQVLMPDEQQARQVSYGPETVVYHNALVQRQAPGPAEMNQEYAAAAAEHPLVAVLSALAAGLADPANHYLINTTSFESPDGPVLLGTLYLHAESVRELVVEADGFTCQVWLGPGQEPAPVRVAFARVWQVLRSGSPQMDLEELEEQGGILYDAPQVVRGFAQTTHLG